MSSVDIVGFNGEVASLLIAACDSFCQRNSTIQCCVPSVVANPIAETFCFGILFFVSLSGLSFFLQQPPTPHHTTHHITHKMSKRAADDESIAAPLKGGDRPEAMDVDKDHDMGEFEDDFEDEFESEDEIIEAGVDGRPDAEREAEEGTMITLILS